MVTQIAFPEKILYVDPTRVEEFVTALGVPPADGWVCEVGAPLPPGFLMYVTAYGVEEVNAALGLTETTTLYGGQQVELHSPVRVGDHLRVRLAVTGETRKPGAGGELALYELTCSYLDDRTGAPVATERSTTIRRILPEETASA